MAFLMLLAFSLTLFLSATLLFLVQPMVGKMILPYLGGTPAVWNTCMVLFQALLLAGYSYAHLLSRKMAVKKQVLLHLLALAIPVGVLVFLRFDVVRVAEYWPPPATANPAGWLLAVLLIVAGLPFLVVSTTAPLLQKWFASTDHPTAHDPYFLYGASNVGSMLALLAYPAFVERKIGVQNQTLAWIAGYLALGVMVLFCGLLASSSATTTAARDEDNDDEAPGLARMMRWVLLAFVPSSLMLGLTTHITTDIAAIPLLWILPLTLYLLSFIFVFAGNFFRNLLHWLALVALCAYVAFESWNHATGKPLAESFDLLMQVLFGGQASPEIPPEVKLAIGGCLVLPWIGLLIFLNRSAALLHGIWVLLLPVLIVAVTFEWDLRKEGWLKEYQAIMLHHLALFVTAMVCHGELARTRPSPAHLTGFYLLMSLGGVLGGLFNALVAPVVFDRIVEYPLVIAFACVLMPRFGRSVPGLLRKLDFSLAGLLFVFGIVMAGFFLGTSYLNAKQADEILAKLPADDSLPEWAVNFKKRMRGYLANSDANLMVRERNFFGCFKVTRMDWLDGSEEFHTMLHGTTTHGMQCYYPEERRAEPLTYFHRKGPIGKLFESVYAREKNQRVCVLGVGTGTLGAYMKSGWDLTLYEIDPAVVRVAFDQRYFTYLPDAEARGAKVKVDLGDGRLQIAKAPDQAYDMIFMDAFTSDAVPVHLLTKEAFEIYLKKLAPGGLIVVNISNRYLDFEAVLGNLAEDLKLKARYSYGSSDKSLDMYGCSWVVMARDDASFGTLLDFTDDEGATKWKPLPTDPDLGVWTDDYSNLLAVFRWNR